MKISSYWISNYSKHQQSHKIIKYSLNGKLFDVTQYYFLSRKSKTKNLQIASTSRDEDIVIGKWLISTFGGSIHLLKDGMKYGKTPDCIWNNEYWEFKSPKSIKRIDDRIRYAQKQLVFALKKHPTIATNCGIVLDISKSINSDADNLNEIIKRILFRGKIDTDIIIKKGNDVIRIFRFIKSK